MGAESIFVTGATGTIGSALVPRLLREPGTYVTVLIRATDEADLARRLDEMYAFWDFAAGDERRSRIRGVRGDISLPALGLDAAGHANLAAETTHIVHSAASVKLTMSMDEALKTAVAPTRSVIALAREAQRSGQLQKVDLVSTVGVWGRTPGAMPERRLPEVMAFHNTYEAAKSESERVVWSEGQGLPITVHRPSMVVGERGSGRVIHFQVFYHLCEFLAGVRTFGVMPELGEQRLDTTPVDWVADAMVWSVRNPASAGRILHLCSGPREAIRLRDLQRVVRDTWQARGRPLPRLWRVQASTIRRLIPVIGWFTGEKGRRALRGLPPVLDYLAEDQAFSNETTAALLAQAGLPLPPVSSYLDAVLAYYLERQRPAGRR